ncbi:malonyl-ACP O-methyltransferase [Sphingobium subterraneum]|uniref:Malonyl-[acyl-carrier protein] O-methyltransferase n=1 Tax=Sphingobium subterraneum TaxID=627688 RepID=A0A841J296_9SPHN|nr:malonyl-ACP O-methyltransferase [Sphingobium subterraneum]MBB6124824.1 malonyl-CoA O-methyltransferase [Sphingobium subterraneum]
MTPPRMQRIRDAFGAAADRYDRHADVQRTVADVLADLARNQPLPPAPRVLEIGCGTGLLTRRIRDLFPDADLTVTDLSPAMLAVTAADPTLAARFEAMDGEAPGFEGPWFDLIVSSLAFQWFSNLPTALARLYALLRPGGTLLFSTMAQRSFAEWRAAHEACGVRAGTPEYPSIETLRAMLDAHADAFLFEEDYVHDFGGARGLLAHLKGIGATVPVEGRAPLGPAALRQVMRAYDAAGGRCTYHVAYCRVTRVG